MQISRFYKMELSDVITKIEETLQNCSMPRRVKGTLTHVKEELMKDNPELAVRATTAVYELDEVANDINIPMHAKTVLWDIISDLEALKKAV